MSKLNARLRGNVDAPPAQSAKELPLASQVLNHRPDGPSEAKPEPVDHSEPLVDEMSILEVVTQSSRGRRAASEMRERSFSAEETERGDADGDDGDAEEEDEKETLEMTQVWIPPYFEREDDDEEETGGETGNG